MLPQLSEKMPKKNEFSYNILPLLAILTGVSLSQIGGISDTSFLEIISKLGTDIEKWQNDKRFAA